MKSITKGISKGTTALLLLYSCLFATPSHALDPDKRGHMKYGLGVGAVTYLTTPLVNEELGTNFDPVRTACVTSVAVGLGKEIYDSLGDGTPEFLDIVATATPWCSLAAYQWVVTVDNRGLGLFFKVKF